MSGTIVNVPGAGQVSFPEGMSDADIETAIKTKILPQLHAETPDAATGTVAAAAHGLTFGFGDELKAGIHALAPGLIDVMNADNPFSGNIPQVASHAPTIGERYDEELAKTRQSAKNFQEAHPYLATGGEIAGNVAGGVALAPTIGIGASLPTTALKYGALGGALGSAQGFGEGEGGFTNRLQSAGTGGVLGAVGGAAVPVAGAIAGKGVEKFGTPLLRKLGEVLGGESGEGVAKSLSAAAPDGGEAPGLVQRLGNAMVSGADKMDTEEAVRNIAARMLQQKSTPDQLEAQAQQLGPWAIGADLGPSMLSQANAARLSSGETNAEVRNLLTERAKQYTPMLSDAFTGGADVPSLHAAGKYFAANEKQVGSDVYGAMREAGLNTSGEMNEMMQVPAVQKAIESVKADAAEAGAQLAPVDVIHRLKQKLGDMAFPSGGLPNRDLPDLAVDFRQAFHKANPAAAAADTAMTEAKSLPDYLELGRRFAQEGTTPGAVEASSDSVADKLANATRGQQQSYTLGVQNAGRTSAGINPTNLARHLTPEKLGIVENLTQALTEPGAQRVLNAANAVRTFQQTANKLQGGSSTVPNAQDIAELNHVRFSLGKGGLFERAKEGLGEMVGELVGPSERVTGRIGSMLTDPDEMENLIAAIRRVLASKASTGAAKAAAGSAAGQSTGKQ
jgi:hypothetical protein